MRKIICILLSVCVLLVGLPFVVGSALKVSNQGQIGDNVYWNYNESTKTLNITGSGPIEDFSRNISTGKVTNKFDSNYWDYECEYVNISEGITTIGNYMFYNYLYLKKIVLPSTIIKIGHYAFSNCKNLEDINFEEGLTTIGGEAFYYCTSLFRVVIPKSMKSVSYDSFSNSSIAEVLNLSKVSKYKFRKAINYTTDQNQESKIHMIDDIVYLIMPDNVYLLDYKGDKKDLVLPDKVHFGERIINKYEIYKFAFFGEESLNSISFGPNISDFGYMSVAYTSGLKEVKFNDKIDSLAHSVLYESSITEIKLPKALKKIPNYAFASCDNLEKVEFNEGLVEIGTFAFAWDNLKEVNLPKSLIKLGYGSFILNNNLEKVKLNEGLNRVGMSAFKSTKIKKIEFPSSLESIGVTAFRECDELVSVTIPSNIKKIGPLAFQYCLRLSEIRNLSKVKKSRFPNVESYLTDSKTKSAIYKKGKYSFSMTDNKLKLINCDENVKNVKLPSQFKIAGKVFKNYEIRQGAFADRNLLKSVVINDNVTKIGESAFEYCKKLKTVVLPKGLKKIESNTFVATGIEKIKLPKSLETIGEWAFNCSKLKEITLPSTVKKIDYYAFTECKQLKKAVVKGKNLKLKRSGIGFSDFKKKKKDFVLFAQKGSKAQEYALKHDIKFVVI